MSVFTHITKRWSDWLTELHRILRPDGLAVVSVLGPAMAQQILGTEWDERIGMACVDHHKNWDVGGPDVLLSEWWVREHWGRGFEILSYAGADPADGAGHDLVVMRRRETQVTPAKLAEVDDSDPRERDALVCNLELVSQQQRDLGSQLRASDEACLVAESRAREAEAHSREAEARLQTVTRSRSWRITAPLRRGVAAIRERRP
jgi:hypothetical protein